MKSICLNLKNASLKVVISIAFLMVSLLNIASARAVVPNVSSSSPGIPTWIASDIEGDFNRLQQLLEMSVHDGQLKGRIVLNGDLVGLKDRKMDFAIMRAFLQLQEKFGADKVILIIGNRELQLFGQLNQYKNNEPERYQISKKFLASSQLFYRIGQALIFHGAFTLENYRYHPETKRTYAHPNLALAELESWFQQIKALALNGHAESTEKLVTYGRQLPNTSKLNSHSIVYGRYSGDGAEQKMPEVEITQFYKSGGISLFINGHTPVGKMPVFMSRDGFGVLVGDTSRSHVSLPEIKLQNDRLSVETPYLNNRVGFHWKIGTTTRFGQRFQNGYLIGRSTQDDFFSKAIKAESDTPKFIQYLLKTPRLMCLHLFN